MGFFRRKWMKKHHDQASFDLLDLHQFSSTSCRYLTAYVFMWITLLISLAVYVSDCYTAVVLIAYNRWSSNIDPVIPFKVSRWLFAGCIILSFVLLIYEFLVAFRVMKSKNVALTYTNNIARNIFSIKGYHYFCLFAKITKSRSKVEYLALFVYFTFKGWIRLIFADSPRQVINALTLYSVTKIDGDFVDTVKGIADKSITQAIVLSFMAFSLLIWVFSIIQFAIALLCAFPLYIHIDKTCSGLEEYCCVRVNRRIAKIVQKHHKKGLMELKEANKKLAKQPTLPTVVLDNDEQTNERFEDILGQQGKSTKKYIAFKKDADIEANGTNNPFHGLDNKESEERTGYGFSNPDAQNSSSNLLSQSQSRGPSRQSSNQTLRTQHSQGTIQKYPGPSRSGSGSSRSLTSNASTLTNNTRDFSNGSVGGGGGAGRPNNPYQQQMAMSPVYEQQYQQQQDAAIPIPTARPFTNNNPNNSQIPVRSVQQNQAQMVQETSPEAVIPPSTVTFDQYSPNSPIPPPRATNRPPHAPMQGNQYLNNQPPPDFGPLPAQQNPNSRPNLAPIRTDFQTPVPGQQHLPPQPHPLQQQQQQQRSQPQVRFQQPPHPRHQPQIQQALPPRQPNPYQPQANANSNPYQQRSPPPQDQQFHQPLSSSTSSVYPTDNQQPTLPNVSSTDLDEEPNFNSRPNSMIREPTLPQFGTPRSSVAYMDPSPTSTIPPRPNFGHNDSSRSVPQFELNDQINGPASARTRSPQQPSQLSQQPSQSHHQQQQQQPTLPRIDLDDDDMI